MEQSFTIRAACATDLPFIYAGELDYIQQIEPQQEARWKGGMIWHLKQWTSNLPRMFVAEKRNVVVGYCFWEIQVDAAVLASIYVLPEQRRCGLGAKLLATFISDAVAKDFKTLKLGVKAENPARQLYERSGFGYTHDENGYQHYTYEKAK